MKYLLFILFITISYGCVGPSMSRIDASIEFAPGVDPKVARNVALAVLKDHYYETKIFVSIPDANWKALCVDRAKAERIDDDCNIDYSASGAFTNKSMKIYGVKALCIKDGRCEYWVSSIGYHEE